ncbi:Argininosuccinate lyase [bioreactor metagenome]|uniref:Argininosuccinate lyase n=1 Tax=bioreactor metagenome TaxID=1076179 RepID=A0A645HVN3_9ZZZZ
MPFRSAYKVTGELVAHCIANGQTLESLRLEDYQVASPLFEEDIFEAISLESCVQKRRSQGGTAPEQVRTQIAWVREKLKEW